VTLVAKSPISWFVVIILGLSAVLFINKNKRSKSPPNIEPGTLPQQPMTQIINPLDSYFSKKIIRVADLIHGSDYLIEDKTFEDCILYGPGVIGFIGEKSKPMRLNFCSFDGDKESLLIEVPDNRKIIGAIGFRGCTLVRCRFIGLGIVGNKEMIDYFRSEIASRP